MGEEEKFFLIIDFHSMRDGGRLQYTEASLTVHTRSPFKIN